MKLEIRSEDTLSGAVAEFVLVSLLRVSLHELCTRRYSTSRQRHGFMGVHLLPESDAPRRSADEDDQRRNGGDSRSATDVG